MPLCSVAGVLEPRSSSSPGGGRGWETQPRRGSASTNTSYFINDLQHILSIFFLLARLAKNVKMDMSLKPLNTSIERSIIRNTTMQ